MAPLVPYVFIVMAAGLHLTEVGTIEECPLDTQLPAAFGRLTPSLSVGGADADGDVHLLLEPTVGGAVLRLVDGSGQELLVRTIPVRPELCSSVADVIVLLTDRYLRDIGWHSPQQGLPALPAGGPAITPAAPAAPGPSLSLELRAGSEVGAPMRWGTSAWLRLHWGPLETAIGLFAWVPASSTVASDGVDLGDIETWSIDARLAGGLCTASEPHRVCANLEIGMENRWAQVTGEWLFQTESRTILQPLLGASGRYQYRPRQSLVDWVAALTFITRPADVGFWIEGAGSQRQSPWAFIAEVGVGWQAL